MAIIPNVISHGLMALDVYNEMPTSNIKKIIERNPQSYLLGSNGPDFLFYYEVFPWQDKRLNKMIADFGHTVHSQFINEFYNYSLKYIMSIKDLRRQEILLSFIAGHFLHWSLDSLAHPFIFYRSGPLEGETKYWHYRYESMIDALMITYVKAKDMSKLNPKKFLDVSEEELRVISTFYQQVLQDVFQLYTSANVISESILNFKKTLNYLYDPYGLKLATIQKFERTISEPWAFSSHVVSSRIDATYDVLNLKKDLWCNPTDDQDCSNTSFIELFDYSVKLGIYILHEMDLYLNGQRTNFDDLLQNRAYDTGREVGKEMKFFNNIYAK